MNLGELDEGVQLANHRSTPPPPPGSPLAQPVPLAPDQWPLAPPLPPRALLSVALVLDLTHADPMSARGVAFLKDWTARNMGGPEQD